MKKLFLLLFLLITTFSFSSKHYKYHSWKDDDIYELDLPWDDVELDELSPWNDIEFDDLDDLDLDETIRFKKNQLRLKGIEIGDDDIDIKIKRKNHHWKHKNKIYDDDDDEYEDDDD